MSVFDSVREETGSIFTTAFILTSTNVMDKNMNMILLPLKKLPKKKRRNMLTFMSHPCAWFLIR